MSLDWNTPPKGIPREAWEAARDITSRFHSLYSDALCSSNNVNDAIYSLSREVAAIIADHISKHRRMVEGLMEVGR